MSDKPPSEVFLDTLRTRVGDRRSTYDLDPGFIGREAELARMWAAYRAAGQAGQLAFALLVGEPGMGKSRLVRELCRRIRNSQPAARIAIGRGDGEGVAYAAFARMLAQRFGIAAGHTAEESQELIMAGVSAVLSADRVTEVAHLLAHLMRVPIPDSPVVGPLAAAPQQLETRMLIALRRFLAADAHRAPVVLAIEDLDSCGPESVNLLLYLAAGLRASPITLIATTRARLFERHQSFPAGDISVDRIDVGPLSAEDTRALLEAMCRPLGGAPERLVAQAHKLGGSPRALAELMHLLLEQAIIVRGDSGWSIDEARLARSRLPESYEDLVGRRLESMPEGERALLRKAAVVGEVFWLDAVVALVRASSVAMDASMEPDGPTLSDIAAAGDSSRSAVSSALDELVRREWIARVDEPTMPGENEYRFAYPNLWISVRRRVPDDESRRYHRIAAQWLELRPEGRRPATQEAIAQHLERAGMKGDAAMCYRRAGDAARKAYFNDRAVGLYRRALDCLGASDVVARMHLWHDLGSIYELVGDFEAALDAFERMLRLAWVVAARSKAAVAFNKMGRVWRRKGDLRLALEYLERGAELFEHTGDQRGIAGSLDDVGRVLYLLGRYDEAHDKISAGLERRGRDGDARSVAASLASLGNIESARGRFAEARRCHQEALDLRREASDRWGVISSLNNIAVLDYEHGDLRLARSGWLQALGEAEEIGALPLAAMALCNLGELALGERHHDEARRRLDDALQIASDIDERRLQAEAMRNLAQLENQLGHPERARELATRSHHIAREAGLRDAEGRALLCLGDIAAALESRQTLEMGLSADPKTPPRAAPTRTAIERAPTELSLPSAEQYFERGITLLRELGNNAELARGLEQLAKYQQSTGDQDAAEALASEAQAIFTRLGLKRGERG